MKAVLIKAPGQAAVVELPMPSIGSDEVLIRAQAVGICGSDVELYQGRRPEEICRYPVIPGHEWSGVVAAVGASVRGIAPGNKVVCEGFLSCGACRNCRSGENNLCDSGYDELGFTRPGGLAEYVAVPARQVHILPDDASLEEAALLEPTAVVVAGYLRARPQPGDCVVVIGAGTIGLLAVHIARLFSPSVLVLAGFRKERLELGRSLGATHTIDMSSEDPLTRVQELTGGRKADLVFEAAGHAEAVAESLRLARRGGGVILEGVAGSNAMLSIESDLFILNHLAAYGIFGAHSAAWSYAVHLFRSGLLHLAPLISHRYPLEEYQDALNTLITRQGKPLKVLITHEEASNS